MGLLIAFIGLIDMGLVQKGERDTLLEMGDLTDWTLWLSSMSLFILVSLYSRNFDSACLVSLTFTSLIFFIVTQEWPTQIADLPAAESPVKMFKFGHLIPSLVGIISFFFVLLFDVSGVVYGIGQKCGLIDSNDQIIGAREAIMSVSIGTIISGFLGCSPMIVGVESMSGVATGGRTGLTAVVCSILFLLSTFFRPLLQFIPTAATSPILVFVGVLMMEQVTCIPWTDKAISLPSFLTIVIMPFTYSISNGVFVGMFSVVLMGFIDFLWDRLSPRRLPSVPSQYNITTPVYTSTSANLDPRHDPRSLSLSSSPQPRSSFNLNKPYFEVDRCPTK